MTAEKCENTTKTFRFSYPACTSEQLQFKLEVPVAIPYDGSTRELVQRVVNMFHIPVYLEDELNERLAEFVSSETKQLQDTRDAALIDQLKSGDLDVDGVVRNWEKLFKENVVEFAEQKGTSDEEVFGAAYHKLVHSPALETILQVESSYAQTFIDMLRSRDEDIQKLTQRQTAEMEAEVSGLGSSSSEQQINALAARHFALQSAAAGKWGSQLDALAQAQRAQHRRWLMDTLQEMQTCDALNTPSNSPLGTFSTDALLPTPRPPPGTATAAAEGAGSATGVRLEESFTIHLGSQLKQTHNIRLVAMDLLDLCRIDNLDPALAASRRLSTSLGLYGSELSAVVLLCDSVPSRPAPPTSLLIKAASASTEHHFADVEAQLRNIIDRVKDPVERRNAERLRDQTAANASTNTSASIKAKARRDLQAGDIFVTTHSNLADVHVVFHLVVDDSSLRSGDITSRHPAILGLRNVLKAACANDVTSVSLPLLLRHEMSEEMTLAWCMRRAELVLKCVKGFALEAAGWGGSELRTLHCALPKDTRPALFAALAAHLPSIFRVAGPVKGRLN